MTKAVQGAKIRILIADDHSLLRQGIIGVLADEDDIELVAEAENGLEAIELFKRHRPDIALMDLRMPIANGIEAILAIRKFAPLARIIVLTTFAGDAQALAALKAGASGYLLKTMLRKDLVEAIRAVHAGKRRIPAEVAAEIAENAATDPLSEREIKVLQLVAQGNSNKLIAAKLNIAESTVKAHMQSILPKLDANDRTHAVTIALRRGIILDL